MKQMKDLNKLGNGYKSAYFIFFSKYVFSSYMAGYILDRPYTYLSKVILVYAKCKFS